MIERVRRLAMNRFAAALPGVAASLYERAMLSPPRTSLSSRVNHRAGTPDIGRLPYGDGWLATRAWGSGPTVLLLHGWSGSSADMEAFIEPLMERGFRAVAFDAPAHGESDGRRTNLIQCGGAALQVGSVFGPVWGIVAHSFGGPCAALACQSGLAVRRLALLGAPCSMAEMARTRAEKAGVPRRIIKLGNRRLADRLRIRWSDIATDRMVSGLDAPVLVVHDRGDRTVPFENGVRLAAAAKDGRLVATTGLGHDALLWDPGIVRQVVDFLTRDPL